MQQVFLTDANNDLYLDASGNFAMATTKITIAQQLSKTFLWTFLGEVFTDTTLGTDYFGIIFNQYNSLQDKINEITRVLLTVPAITSVESIAYTQYKQSGVITFNPTVIIDSTSTPLGSIPVGI